MKQHYDSTFSAVESAIRATGARVTSARVQVFSLLQDAQGPLSHSDIEQFLSKNVLPDIDRVTLYRVLDWLVKVGLAHKVANTRGVFCYISAQPNVKHKRHMHFRCNDCGRVICLDVPPPLPPELPTGFHIASIELEISGECPDCVRSNPDLVQHSVGSGALQ